MAAKSSFQSALEGFGVTVERIDGVGLGVAFVIHTECLFDVGAMDLDDPAAFLGKRHGLGVGPIKPREVGGLLA
ncbi:MAG: hypothetical protein AAGH41_11805 [Pseudomonadota bacterium]